MGRGTKTLLDFQEYYFDINESRGRKKDLGKNTDLLIGTFITLHSFVTEASQGVICRRRLIRAIRLYEILLAPQGIQSN